MISMHDKIYGIDLGEGSQFQKAFEAENFSQELIDLFWGSDFVGSVYDGKSTSNPEYFGIHLNTYDNVSHMLPDNHDILVVTQQYKELLAELEVYIFDSDSDHVSHDERKRFFNILKDTEPKVFFLTGTS